MKLARKPHSRRTHSVNCPTLPENEDRRMPGRRCGRLLRALVLAIAAVAGLDAARGQAVVTPAPAAPGTFVPPAPAAADSVAAGIKPGANDRHIAVAVRRTSSGSTSSGSRSTTEWPNAGSRRSSRRSTR
jgi:hypothetical protein